MCVGVGLHFCDSDLKQLHVREGAGKLERNSLTTIVPPTIPPIIPAIIRSLLEMVQDSKPCL